MRDLLGHLRGPVHEIGDRGTCTRATPSAGSSGLFRLTGHFLPPYAPELSPVEHVWNHVKYGVRANFLPTDLEALNRYVDDVLRRAGRDPSRKRSFFEAPGSISAGGSWPG
jgi:transposase